MNGPRRGLMGPCTHDADMAAPAGQGVATASPRTWLADHLIETLATIPGSQEREQVLELLGMARRIRLGDRLAAAAARTLRLVSGSIERWVAEAELPAPATWIEFSHAARLADSGTAPDPSAPALVGALLAADPGAPQNVAIFVAWQAPDATGGTAGAPIHHSYALLHWDLDRFGAIARAAPRADDGRAPERLMELARATVPPGLLLELEVWQGYGADDGSRIAAALGRTERDALGEHLFLITAMLMIGSQAIEVTPAGPGAADWWHADLAPDARRRVWPWTGRGFHRPVLGGPLAWTDPASILRPFPWRKGHTGPYARHDHPILG